MRHCPCLNRFCPSKPRRLRRGSFTELWEDRNFRLTFPAQDVPSLYQYNIGIGRAFTEMLLYEPGNLGLRGTWRCLPRII